jgi:hypothetical protein
VDPAAVLHAEGLPPDELQRFIQDLMRMAVDDAGGVTFNLHAILFRSEVFVWVCVCVCVLSLHGNNFMSRASKN